MTSEIRISVITATWNSDATLQECINSIDAQSYKNYEHIVVDGGSSDKSLQLLRLNDKPFRRVIEESDDGIYDALNKGIQLAAGDIIGFLHSDDIFFDDKVLEDIAIAFSDPLVCAVYGNLYYVDKGNTSNVVRRWITSSFQKYYLTIGWMPPHPTLYVRKEWYTKIGGFDTAYKISADYLSILQLFSQENFISAYIPRVLIKMRLGGVSNRSIKDILQKTREDYRALKNTKTGGVITLILKNICKIHQYVKIN
jgi:glycosyltransferase involved in cell wall biosynthesis